MTDRALKRRKLILEGNLWKAVLVLAIPAAINDFIRAMYNLIDTLFVANIGSMEVAAITFVGPLNMLVRTMGVGLAIAATNLIAREIGRGDYKKAKRAAMQILAIAIGLGCAIAVLGWVYSNEILIAASATEGIFDVADTYFRLTVLSAPFIFINSMYVAIKRAEGDTLKAMIVNSVGMVVKIFMSYIFIIRMDLGISGLAYSTIIGTVLVSMYGIYDMFVLPSVMKLSMKHLKFSGSFLWALLLIALPVMIEKSSVSFSFIILNKYVIDYGEKVLAGYGIANRNNSMFFATVTGFASGLSPVISQNLGAGNEARAKAAVNKTFIMAIGIATVIVSMVLPFRTNIAAVFAKGDAEVLYHTVNAMSVYSITVIPWAIFQVANGVFQGTGHTKYNMIISIMRIYLFRLPIVILLSKYSDLGEYSIWYSMLYSNILTGVFAYFLYLYHRKDLRLSGEMYRPQKVAS
mgnify:CR=1 FL=1